MLCRLQVASETTLEEAEGVYMTKTGPRKPLKKRVGMARFVTLRSLWLRQCNNFTLVFVGPDMPTGLKCEAMPSLSLYYCAHDRQPEQLCCAVKVLVYTSEFMQVLRRAFMHRHLVRRVSSESNPALSC